MEQKQSVRIQTSILNAAEKKTLVWLAKHMPRFVKSDDLSLIGFIGSVIICAGYVLTNLNMQWLWLASFGLVVNWYGDSLDGTLARVRNTQRPRYGYYLDHNLDCINEGLMFVGAGLSALMNHLAIALAMFSLYLMLTVYVSINAHIKQEFKLTYGKLGPTEFRVIIIIVNTVFALAKPLQEMTNLWSFSYFGKPVVFSLFDTVGLAICAILLIIWLVSFFQDLNYFAKLEPLPKATNKKAEQK